MYTFNNTYQLKLCIEDLEISKWFKSNL